MQEESLVLPESSVTAAAQARSCRPGRLCKSCVCSAAGDLPCAGLTEEGQVCFFKNSDLVTDQDVSSSAPALAGRVPMGSSLASGAILERGLGLCVHIFIYIYTYT